ncbi:GntR family transcriptional regulator [Albimonas pacifica]|uniref:Transcriptional regulator, GntR family n=1 Tax=Albimonas pacifica TaxID=1114924 RepID=A0A1I3CKZ6_9RHOB|nr:GntR family transcriptional regulator [Albimonas pacifica]SFH75177.1 transcriptional regulator, GntR family [Albimonas pacifica]
MDLLARSDALLDAAAPQTPLAEVGNLSDRVRAYLLAQLTAGELAPGERINEAELARRLGISRNPVREAVAGLVRQGFLVARPRRGAFLRTFTRKDADDIFSFRIAVETFALRQALALGEPGFGLRMRMIAGDMLEAARTGDVGRMHELDIAFHRTICVASDNRAALRAHEAMDASVRMMIATVNLREDPLELSAGEHLAIAEAIDRREADRAEGLLAAHIRRSRSNVVLAPAAEREPGAPLSPTPRRTS